MIIENLKHSYRLIIRRVRNIFFKDSIGRIKNLDGLPIYRDNLNTQDQPQSIYSQKLKLEWSNDKLKIKQFFNFKKFLSLKRLIIILIIVCFVPWIVFIWSAIIIYKFFFNYFFLSLDILIFDYAGGRINMSLNYNIYIGVRKYSYIFLYNPIFVYPIYIKVWLQRFKHCLTFIWWLDQFFKIIIKLLDFIINIYKKGRWGYRYTWTIMIPQMYYNWGRTKKWYRLGLKTMKSNYRRIYRLVVRFYTLNLGDVVYKLGILVKERIAKYKYVKNCCEIQHKSKMIELIKFRIIKIYEYNKKFKDRMKRVEYGIKDARRQYALFVIWRLWLRRKNESSFVVWRLWARIGMCYCVSPKIYCIIIIMGLYKIWQVLEKWYVLWNVQKIRHYKSYKIMGIIWMIIKWIWYYYTLDMYLVEILIENYYTLDMYLV